MELHAKKREAGAATNVLRNEGFIPAELYGHDVPNIHLAVEGKAFRKVFREAGESTVITLAVEGSGEKHPVVVHDIQRHSVDGTVSHIDFYQVRMDEKMRARIPIEFVGESPAVKEHGGFLNKTTVEVEVEALPGDLPARFTVDFSTLRELNQSIYVRDLAVPKNVRITADAETVIVTVTPPRVVEEAPIAPVADVTAVKVESEEKKAEREKEKASGERTAEGA